MTFTRPVHLRSVELAPGFGGQVRPTWPTSPTSPPRLKLTLAGLLVGLVLHAGAGWWSETASAQCGGTNTTCTTSTTAGTTFVSPPDCGPVGTSTTQVSVTTETTIGPATILVGPNQSQTLFVPAGTININVNTHTQTIQCIAAVPALPWPGLISTALGLGGFAAWRLRSKRRRKQTDESRDLVSG